MAGLKRKGDLAELKVAAELVARGCRLSIPFGEDHDYDLIADFEGRLHRIQVKYAESDGRVITHPPC
jgi:PD-(D/E)XK endonuclease